MIIPMKKLEIIIYGPCFKDVLEKIQSLGYVNLDSVPLHRSDNKGQIARIHLSKEEEQEKTVLKEVYAICNELEDLLGRRVNVSVSDEKKQQLENLSIEERLNVVMKYRRQLKSLLRRKRNIDDNRNTLLKFKNIAPFVESLKLNEDVYTIHTFSFPSEENNIKKKLLKEIKNLPFDVMATRLFSITKKRTLGVIVCAQEYLQEVKQMTWKVGTIEFTLPPIYGTKSIIENFHLIEADLESLPKKIESIKKQIDVISKDVYFTTAVLKKICFLEEQRLSSAKYFVKGTYVNAIHIWIPDGKMEDIQSLLEESTKGSFTLTELLGGFRENSVPVVLKNNAYSKPFEILLNLFPPPTYNTFDPTFFNSISLPFFYGLIVGDIGYGIIIFLLTWLLKSRFQSNNAIQSVAKIGFYCSISTIAFGALFSEFFGDFGHRSLHMWAPFFDREKSESIVSLLVITAGIGYLHISLGVIIGLINARLQKDKHAFIERLGQLGFVLSLLFLVGGFVFSVPALKISAMVLLAGSIITLVTGIGPLSILELVGLLTNMLSYTRLMALGVASVVIAKVANVLFHTMNTSITGLISGLLVAVALHSLNIVMSLFSPTIHSLRLHYVEFFTKFYRSEGRKNTPFG